MAAVGSPRITLADALLKEGLINRDQHHRALQEYERTTRSLIRILTDMGAINDNVRLDILRRSTEYDVVDLANVIPSAEVSGYITRDQCRRMHAVPLRLDDGTVIIAMEDPTDVRTLADLEKLFDHTVKPVLASAKGIDATIEKLPEMEVAHLSGEHVAPSVGYRILSALSLMVICFGPMIGFYFFILQTTRGTEWYAGLGFSRFENILFFLVVWGSWAGIAHFLNDLVFGRKRL